MTIVYFVAIGPFALVHRLRADSLALRGRPSWRWLPRADGQASSLDAMKQQF